ncbi:MAG: hypothetical protein JXQ93_06350 [Flavobacteriaceae bacterium]
MQNKTSKYFKYAIGEIVLVIIGILIALQINNWNQNRISKIELNQSLNKLLVELNSDLLDLEDKIDLNDKIIKNLDSSLLILKELANFSVKDFEDKFHYINYTSTFNFNRVTFNEISNSGKLKQLNNTVLSDSLINYYSQSLYKVVEEALVHHVRSNIRTHTLGFDYLDFKDELETYKASDFNIKKKTLKEYRGDVRILNAIRLKILLHRYCKINYKSIIPRTKYLIKIVEKELENN